jgi:hypothetical protein
MPFEIEITHASMARPTAMKKIIIKFIRLNLYDTSYKVLKNN